MLNLANNQENKLLKKLLIHWLPSLDSSKKRRKEILLRSRKLQLLSKEWRVTIGTKSKRKRSRRLINGMQTFTKLLHQNQLQTNKKTLQISSLRPTSQRMLPQWSKALPSQAPPLSCQCLKISYQQTDITLRQQPTQSPSNLLCPCQCQKKRSLSQSTPANFQWIK